MPEAIVWGGRPEYDANGEPTGWTLITHDGLAEMAGYLQGLANWAKKAEACLATLRQ